jgi:lipoteichoic acid synthase
MKRRPFPLLFTTLVVSLTVSGLNCTRRAPNRKYDPAAPSVPAPKFIAHAGGGIGKLSYTNSRDALDANYNRGHRFFEIDLNWTSDDKLVLIHDWQGAFRDLFPKAKIGVAPSLQEFLRMKMKNNLTPISFSGLVEWLDAHPGARIVTDVKDDNLRALKRIAEEHPKLLDRIIPQVYALEEYDPVWDMGYRNIILTLYVKNYPDDQVLAFAQSQRPFGITMWAERAMGPLPKELEQMKIPVFAHTINSPEEQKKLEANGVSGIYTDFLGGEK